jgi:hypothetical protein
MGKKRLTLYFFVLFYALCVLAKFLKLWENLRDVPVSVEVVLVAGLAGGVHRGVPIGAGARVRAGQRGVHFRNLQ